MAPAMNKTFIPEFGVGVLTRLAEYAAHFAADFRAGHVPLALRLLLSASWLEDAAQLDKTGVPATEHCALSNSELALELLDMVRAQRCCRAKSWWATAAMESAARCGQDSPLMACITAGGHRRDARLYRRATLAVPGTTGAFRLGKGSKRSRRSVRHLSSLKSLPFWRCRSSCRGSSCSGLRHGDAGDPGGHRWRTGCRGRSGGVTLL